MTKRVFILEDDPMRMREFYRVLIGKDQVTVTHIESCSQVDRFKPPYDVICLDHDLGGRQLVEHEDNGHLFTKLVKDLINPDAAIIVHSYNHGGARNMLETLGRGVYMPFGPEMLNHVKALLTGDADVPRL